MFLFLQNLAKNICTKEFFIAFFQRIYPFSMQFFSLRLTQTKIIHREKEYIIHGRVFYPVQWVGLFFSCFYDSLVCNSVQTKNIFEKKYFCQFLASSAKQTKNNFTVRKSYKTRKSTKNRLSNFGLIEETMDLSRIQCNTVRMYQRRILLSA